MIFKNPVKNKETVYNLCQECLNYNRIFRILKTVFNRIIKVYKYTKAVKI